MKSKEAGYFSQRMAKVRAETTYSLEPDFPSNALIELTNGCNHKCLFCKNSNQSRHPTYLKQDLFEKFIKEASALGLKEVGLYATGEPFMTKNLDEYIAIAKSYGIGRVYITSNGSLATLDRVKKCVAAGLNSIKFSINASNREDYIKVHGADDFEKVHRNVADIYEWKTSHKINLQMLGSCVIIPSLSGVKEEHFSVFGEYLEDIAYVKASSQGGQVYDIPLDKNVLSKAFFESKEVADSDLSPCPMVFNRYHLTAEGYLTACCVDYNLNLVFSDLNTESVKDGWLNKYITELRQKHLDRKLDGTICHQCLKNKKLPYEPIRNLEANVLNQDKQVAVEEHLMNRISSLEQNHKG